MRSGWPRANCFSKAKRAWDDRLEPDGYIVGWNASPDVSHAHLHVLPRFDDEPFAAAGLRFAVKHPDNQTTQSERSGQRPSQTLDSPKRAAPN